MFVKIRCHLLYYKFNHRQHIIINEFKVYFCNFNGTKPKQALYETMKQSVLKQTAHNCYFYTHVKLQKYQIIIITLTKMNMMNNLRFQNC